MRAADGMQSNGVRRRKVLRYESVSKTANSYRRSDHLSLTADSSGSSENSNPQSPGAGPAYRYEYEYERSSFEIFSPASSSFAAGSDILEQAVGEDIAQQFDWLAETDTVRTYENRLTRRYVHIDSMTGQFCDQQRNAISMQAALSYAMPASQVLPSRLPLPSLADDLPIGSFLRHPLPGSRSTDREPAAAPSFGPPEDAQGSGVLSQIRRLVTRFRSHQAFSGSQDSSPPQRAGLSLHEDDRGADRGPDEFSLAAFTRRAA